MGHLAYDPTRLALARPVVDDTVAALATLTSSDRDAAWIVTNVRATLAEARGWLGLADRVLGADPLGRGALSHWSLQDILLGVTAPAHWAIATDWTSLASSITASDAAALGERLSDDDFDWRYLSNAEVAEIDRLLAAIATDPDLSAAFTETFSGWNTTLNGLGRVHQSATDIDTMNFDDSIGGLIRSYESIVASFGLIRQSMSTTKCMDDTGWLLSLEPYAAAMVLPYVGFDDERFGSTAAQIYQAWVDSDPDLSAEIPFGVPHLPGDALFTHLAVRPAAAATFLDEGGFTMNELVMGVNQEFAGLEALLVRGTSPDVMDLATAGRVVPPLLLEIGELKYRFEWHVHDRTFGDQTWSPSALAATFAVPWMLQLSPGNEQWPIDMNEKAAILQGLVGDEAAAAVLSDRTQTLLDDNLAGLAVDQHDEVMGDVAALIGMLAQVIANDKVESEQHRLDQYEMVGNLVGIASGFIPVPMLASVAIDAGVVIGQAIIEDQGWFNYPDPERVEREQNYMVEWTMTVGAASVLLLCAPASSAPPEPDLDAEDPMQDYLNRVETWAQQTFDDPDEAAAITAPMYFYLANVNGGQEVAD
jgi:hypothetical protein